MHRWSAPNISKEWLGCLFLLFASVIASIESWHGPIVGDEHVHFAQVLRFLAGDFSVDRDYLTTIPGFHLLVAALMWPFDADSIAAARFCNAAFGIAATVAFYALRRRAGHGDGILPTLQFAALPLLFPFFFLAYTDVLSLALVLAATLATISGRHLMAGCVLILAMLVRQNNVVWLGFLGVLAVVPTWQDLRQREWRKFVARALPYAVGVVAFCVYWRVNGSVSLSAAQARAHPDAAMHLGNVYFTLFLAGILLPLQTLFGLRIFWARVTAQPWLALLPVVLFAMFWWGFEVDHPYNLIDPQWSLRNQILQASQQQAWLHAVVGLISVMAACGLGSLRLQPKVAAWLYPFSAAFLASSWLIETRYALIPMALWLAFREPCGRRTEMLTFAVWIAAASWLYFSVMHGRPFL